MGHYVYKNKKVLLQRSLNIMVTPPQWETVYDHRKAVLQLSVIYKVSEMNTTESVVFRNTESGRTCVRNAKRRYGGLSSLHLLPERERQCSIRVKLTHERKYFFMRNGFWYCPIPVFVNFSFSRDPDYVNGFDLRSQKSEIYKSKFHPRKSHEGPEAGKGV